MASITDYGQLILNRAIGIRITVDGKYVPLDNYNAFLIEKETIRKAPTTNVVNARNTFVRYISNIEENDDELILKFLITGLNHQGLWEKTRELSNLLQKCLIDIDTESYSYDCILNEYSDEFISWDKLILTMKFNCQCYSPTSIYDVLNGKGNYMIRGAKATPISFMVKAKENVQNVTINEIKIKSLNKGDVLFIDSFNCQILKNGNNAIDEIEIFDFPRIKGNYEVNVSTLNIEVQLLYRARW